MPTDPNLPALGDATAPSTGVLSPGDDLPDARARAFIVGTPGHDRLSLEGGATAYGAGGDDTFVLVSTGGGGVERLGVVLDFGTGDSLDLTRLGPQAAILGRGDIEGGARVTIDYNGDGVGDGVVLLYSVQSAGGVVPGDVTALPEPGGDDLEGVVTILPFPLPGDGPFTILPDPNLTEQDGVLTILPYPMLGDGSDLVFPGFDLGQALVSSDWAI